MPQTVAGIMASVPKINRRRFLGLAALSFVGAAGGAEAFALEPHRLRVTRMEFSIPAQTQFVAWSDFHYSGDAEYAQHVVTTINDLHPEFICFLGDLVHDRRYQEEALRFIAQLKAPVFGIPGNHDYASRSSFSLNKKVFSATGGAYLVNQIARPSEKIELCGSSERYVGFVPNQPSDRARVLLAHYPMTAQETNGRRFAAILAGHSHGGQIRLPFYGSLYVPRHVGRYDMGLFDTPGGPLYVNVGVGTFRLPARFNCPPEITVVKI